MMSKESVVEWRRVERSDRVHVNVTEWRRRRSLAPLAPRGRDLGCAEGKRCFGRVFKINFKMHLHEGYLRTKSKLSTRYVPLHNSHKPRPPCPSPAFLPLGTPSSW